MNIAKYLDSTYLKTPEQSGLSEEETKTKVIELCDEAIANNIFAVMIRPDYVKEAKNYLANSEVKVGTVIGFHEGTYSKNDKYKEAEKAIEDGADELDFVINYQAYLNGNMDLVKDEVIECSKLGLNHNKVVKWIIEIAALNDNQIGDITKNISNWCEEKFDNEDLKNIFVKSSTGFYKTEESKPNGATVEGIKIMLENSGKLPIKAAGGVRTSQDAEEMIKLGVTRIGTSSALALINNESAKGDY